MKKIYVVSGMGQGRTELSAFDDALYKAGIANFNLIYLSSVIPPDLKPKVVSNAKLNNVGKGERLYVVMSSYATSEKGKGVWAGVGWVLSKKKGNPGLFVEHHGGTKKEVEVLIKQSLEDMTRRRKGSFGPIQKKIIGGVCKKESLCALVVAVYKVEKWS